MILGGGPDEAQKQCLWFQKVKVRDSSKKCCLVITLCAEWYMLSCSYSKTVSGDSLYSTAHFKLVVNQGCSVVCDKFDMLIYL